MKWLVIIQLKCDKYILRAILGWALNFKVKTTKIFSSTLQRISNKITALLNADLFNKTFEKPRNNSTHTQTYMCVYINWFNYDYLQLTFRELSPAVTIKCESCFIREQHKI